MTVWLRRQGHPGQSQEDSSSGAAHGPGGDLSQAISLKEEDVPRDLPLSSEKSSHYQAESVFSTDITYLRLKKGIVSLTDIADWYSQYV